ncbi:MAG: DUF169 domain-containing protein [Candidatus Latescibacterota bacterium]
MDTELQQSFTGKWRQYFGNADLPVCLIYAEEARAEDRMDSETVDRCLIGNLRRVLEGHPYVYDAHTAGCPGGKRYSGFTAKLRPNFEYFLSCGIPGELEGERYKQTPELVQRFMASHTPFEAPARYLIFKRWDTLRPEEEPLLVVFVATPDVLSGLFTLANYDVAETDGVIAPMGSGCSSIIAYPLAEGRSGRPRCVLGMFDVSARPSVPAGALTFAVPMARFRTMVASMDESFLITPSWSKVRSRIAGG